MVGLQYTYMKTEGFINRQLDRKPDFHYIFIFIYILTTRKLEEMDERLFPFYLPWDDSEENILNVSSYLHKPSGSLGYVYVGEDGHLYAGGKRIRFLGVNICGGTSFPEKEESEKIAARLAKFGVNIVRFHHMDASWEAFNIFNKNLGNTRHLNEEAIKRLDYFIAKLKENGIYVDLNLLVSRGFVSADGLPEEVDTVEWKDQQVLGFFVDDVMKLEKEYARQLLTHRNPYTGLSYTDDPAVAFIEIVNEQGLIHGWLGGVIDRLPSVFKGILQEKWNKYLKSKYGSTEKIRKAWRLQAGEALEESKIQIFTRDEFGGKTIAARRDWVKFLLDLEETYFTEMYRYIKEEIGAKSLVIGTIVGCSTPNIMSKLDVIDTHAYWNHPAFPGRPWDPKNWYVINEPMINHLDESTVSWLSLKRIYGKPHIVSEYNHPAPNMYDAETAVIIATYAALQDWDGIFLFDYGRRKDWDSKRIRGYFDIDQHPLKMATLLPAYAIFVRGDLKPAGKMVTANLDREKEVSLIADGKISAWNLPDGRYIGIPTDAPLVYRTALVVEGGSEPLQSLSPQNAGITGSVYRSDTEEVTWDISDRERGVLLINTSRSKAIIGFGGGKCFNFGSVTIEPGDTLLQGWSVITVTVIEGKSFTGWNRLLLTATGYTINSGMKIREYKSKRTIVVGSKSLASIKRYNDEITCDTEWGEAPTLVEGVPVTVKIKNSSDIEVWALNNTGERTQKIPIRIEGNYVVFSVGPEYRTIWYEISAKPK